MNRTKLVMTEHSTQSLTSAASLFREEKGGKEVMSREGGGGPPGPCHVRSGDSRKCHSKLFGFSSFRWGENK